MKAILLSLILSICAGGTGNAQEVMPEFIGGHQKLYQFIGEHIKYPVSARKNGVSGSVIVQFDVNEYGELTNIQTVSSPGYGLDEEAMRVVRLMNYMWTPGSKDGRTVPVTFTLPIKFVLGNPKKS